MGSFPGLAPRHASSVIDEQDGGDNEDGQSDDTAGNGTSEMIQLAGLAADIDEGDEEAIASLVIDAIGVIDLVDGETLAGDEVGDGQPLGGELDLGHLDGKVWASVGVGLGRVGVDLESVRRSGACIRKGINADGVERKGSSRASGSGHDAVFGDGPSIGITHGRVVLDR